MFLRQALRYRWSQALVLAGISLLIGTCAVFGPWFARAVQQTVVTETLHGQRLSAAWQLETRPVRNLSDEPPKPEQLQPLIPADLAPLFTKPVLGIHSDVSWTGTEDPIVSRLLWRDGVCDQVVIVAGRCPAAANEVLASTVDQSTWGIEPGQTIRGIGEGAAQPGVLKVVGQYRPKDGTADYWFGRPPTGRSHPPTDKSPGETDLLLTARPTFAGDLWSQHTTLDTRPLPGVVRLDDLDRLESATTASQGKAIELGADNTSALPGVIDQIRHERAQAATIIPLVMVQVALFGLVVLALALAVVVDQRRPELAVARLRGSTARRTSKTLTVELGLPVLIGTLLGAPLGFALLLIVRSTWLRHGAPIELPWSVPVALVAVAVVALGVVVLQVRGVVRLQIATLLRRVAPSRRRAIGVIDLCIIVFAVAGLLSAVGGSNRGPLPVLAPALLALAAGLTFAHLLLPLAGLISRRALRRGRLSLALGTLQISRRPAVTRIVAAVAVAASLVAFAGQAASVGEHNRESRAGYETGAEGVLKVEASYVARFMHGINEVDRDRRWLTPVLITRPPSPDALQTVMIEPDSFRTIAYRGDQLTDLDGFRDLSAPSVEPIEFSTRQLTVTASTGPIEKVAPEVPAGATPPVEQPPAKSIRLTAYVVDLRTGARNVVTFPPLPLGKPPTVLRAPLDCRDGCRLLRLGVSRELGDQGGLRGDVHIEKLSADDQPALKLGRPEDWRPMQEPGSNQDRIAAKPGAGLTLAVTSFGAEQVLQYATAPAVVPALIAPDYRWDPSATTPAFDGTPIALTKLDRLGGPINRFPLHSAVIDLETGRRIGGTVDEASTQFELWLNAEGVAKADSIIAKLRAEGLSAQLIDQRTDRIASYGRSASALALQLTPVVGIAGWALAIVVLLLTVVTSWRSRAQDYASLRITGVPAATTGRAARWEQTGPVALAVLLGSMCGVVGAQIALPLIPLFADAGGPIPLELEVNWPVAVLLWAVSTAVLAAVTLLLGTGVNRRAGFARIREELT
ncbi:ABC transporter permease [Kribbella sandramycini]|uniref:ABC transporter permease n=1 Tax=Kribbella sandramycini TaxID=60450 RepID=A0A7Y4NYV1_9ACTN|nr:ABC transporter permease [Kribbella sandramycini]MBB6568102.1 hypothetical protein [Kribbella sandramycini]NOL39304.1 ABC transporter permease [Kribbella sandramycini]